MGWSSGSILAEDVWKEVKEYVPDSDMRKVAHKLYDLFCDYDADDWCGDTELEQDAGVNQNTED